MIIDDTADAIEEILKTAKVLEALLHHIPRDQPSPAAMELVDWQLNELMIRIEDHAAAVGVGA